MELEINQITEQIIGAAMKVHTALGPGLLESAYEKCLAFELSHQGIAVRSQVDLPITYGGVTLDAGYRLDLLVEEQVIVELKTVEQILPIHKAQILSYLKLSNRRVGLLLNFHTEHLRDGITRMVHD